MRQSIAHTLAVGIAACILVLSLNLLAPGNYYHPLKVTHSTRRAFHARKQPSSPSHFGHFNDNSRLQANTFEDVSVVLSARSDWRVHRTLGKRDALRCDNGECNDGSCCGKNHTCGYGPDFCGDGCISKCEATAMCGEYSENADMDCGMMLCCSAMGWCGVSSPLTSPRLRSHEHEICAAYRPTVNADADTSCADNRRLLP